MPKRTRPASGNLTGMAARRMSGLLFKMLTGLDLAAVVHYAGGGPALKADRRTGANHVQAGVGVDSTLVRSGQLRALAVTRSDAFASVAGNPALGGRQGLWKLLTGIGAPAKLRRSKSETSREIYAAFTYPQ